MATVGFLLVWLAAFHHGVRCLPEVVELRGESDFRSVKLRWKSGSGSREGRSSSSFAIKYCEDQAWGKYRCRQKIINDPSKNEVQRAKDTDDDDDYSVYETWIDGLRMATNYTFEVVTPEEDVDPAGALVRPAQRGRALGGKLFLQTKGFYARAINCLANSSLIEIETGPYFGGKISVEGSSAEECMTQGDFSSSKSSYLLRINHTLCGSELTNASVKTYVIVQENLPILTHSTRRFMVVCKYVPETFTVRAGVNLPGPGREYDKMVPVDNSVSEIDPSDLFDPRESLFNSRVAKQVGRALKFSSQEQQHESQKWSHLALMIVLVVSTVVGLTFGIFYFVRQTRKRNAANGLIHRSEDAHEEESSIGDSVGTASTDGASQRVSEDKLNSSLPPITGDYLSESGTSHSSAELTNTNAPSPTIISTRDNNNDQTLTNNLLYKGHDNESIDEEYRDSCRSIAGPDSIEAQGPISITSFIPGNHSNAVPIVNLENIDAVFDEVLSDFDNTPDSN